MILEGIEPVALNILKRADYNNIEYLETALSEDQLIEKIQDVFFLGIRSGTKVTAKVLRAAKKLAAIGCYCIGTNQVDLETASELGIAVFNAPFSNTRSVAELVLAEMILLLRNIPARNAAAHRGIWQKSAKDSHEIRGKTLGIIGYGNIGSQLSVLAEAMGMKVYFYDIVTKLAIGNAKPVAHLDELLEISDIVTVHVPETPLTKNMIAEPQFKRMKKGAVFINASRGTVVDIKALEAALESKQLLGAAIDVFPQEPKNEHEPFTCPLQKFDNVILTPHIGGSTVEAQISIAEDVTEKLIRFSDVGSTLYSVNFPEVSLPEVTGLHRIIHIHKNVPGVLSKINKIFSENNINIASQYLRTKGSIGYVVIDLDVQYSKQVKDLLKNIEETIKCRAIY